MKQYPYDPDDYQMCEWDDGSYVEFAELQALCREVLPHIEASLRRRVKKMNQAVGHQTFQLHSNAVNDKQAIVDKLKAIIEAKP